MNFELKSVSLAQAAEWEVDALLVLCADEVLAASRHAQDPVSVWVQSAIAAKDLEEGTGKLLQAYGLPGVTARRLVFARAGDGSAAQSRKAMLAAMASLKGAKVKSLGVYAGSLGVASVNALVQAVAEGSYAYTATKSVPQPRLIRRVDLGVTDAGVVRSGFELGCATVRGTELAKEWANRPANHATPKLLAEAAQQLAKKPHLSCEVLGPSEVEKLGMGAFLAVAQGSDQPLRFIVLKYQGASKSVAPVVLVGKGITFDTGGISIKPAAEMDEMKFDMGGAASVLGTFAALAECRPALNVVGLIPSCENMPSGRAVKPGDVVTSMSGQTIEVLNTDAEGRLILCDALTYAQRFEPRALVDIATLTGACVIALGGVRAGLFSNQDELAQQLQEAGNAALDLCWRLPLDDDYAEGLKSNFADMGNVGGRQAGVVTAAKFLQKFVQPEQAWAHLDIAGVAWKSGAAKGATGRPVGLLLQYLVDEAARIAAELPARVETTAKPVKAVKAKAGRAAKAPKAAKKG
ncbi:leucyl aminopeptidase [Malikia sp.]|uniref:leucyl aminopeptidase n=1 Tax=Malikia sp. TaxID=2070706 RepID=UPI00261FA836|nr:leucyl aminopeptidase [Malikia sp.]MDD2730423.1 leucyl aminopeptidase [Malikia sp.]